ncbi:MAG: hypothetical protein WCD89_07075 [Anaerocolumna sp.]
MNENNIFLFGFSIFYIQQFLQTTMFESLLPNVVFQVLRFIGVGIIVTKIILFGSRMKKYTLFFQIIIIISFVLAYKMSTYNRLIYLCLIMIGTRNVNFRKLIKVYFYLSFFLTLGTIISSNIGIIENLQYFRAGKIRNSFGFSYPTECSARIFYMIFYYIYMKMGKLRTIEYTCIIAIAFLTDLYTSSRLSLYIIVFAVTLTILYNIRIKNNFSISKFEEKFLSNCYLLIGTISVIVTWLYSENNVLLTGLDAALSGRLHWGKMGIKLYNLSLFGKEITMTGLAKGNIDNSNYFYMDCSYVNILLRYGTVVFVIIIVSMNYMCKKNIKNKNYLFVLIMFLVAISSVINEHLVDIAYNPFILSILAFLPIEESFSDDRKKYRGNVNAV